MPLIDAPKNYVELDLEAEVKNWEENRNGVDIRKGNSANAINQIIDALNHLAGSQARQLFCQNFSDDCVNQTDAVPQLIWRYDDKNENGRTYTVHVITVKYHDAATWGSYFYQKDVVANESYKITGQTDKTDLTLWTDVEYSKMHVWRGAQDDAEKDDGISTVDGCVIADISVNEDPIKQLSSTNNAIGIQTSPLGIVGTQAETIREAIHELRTTCLPIIFSWSAVGAGASCPTTAAASDSTGICVESATYVNLFDQTITARSATSVGAIFDAYKCGIGASGNLKCQCRVYAKTIDGSGSPQGYVKFEGPDSIASNTTEIGVTSTSFSWLGDTTNFIYLDTDIEYDNETTSRNKIDMFGKITASDKLQIAAISIFASYS